MLAPRTNADSTPGCSRTNRRCFRRSVEWIAGSMYMTAFEFKGAMLLGSPTFAMPLWVKEENKREVRKVFENYLFIIYEKDHQQLTTNC